MGQIIIIGVIVVGMIIAYNRISYINKLKAYAKRFENIYVVSCHPSGNVPDLDFLEEYCVFSSYKKTIKTAKEEKDFLELAGNKMIGAEIKESARLKVIPIIFRDGFPNESWEDFQDRAMKEIIDDRDKRHQVLRYQTEWYHQHHNQQLAA